MTDFTRLIDLANQNLGGAAIATNDDFFAEKENLVRPKKPVFLEHEYTDRGKWMDGWESRRRRTPGHDWCIVRLGMPGIIHGFVVDTAFFRGNYPEHCSIEGCSARLDADVATLLGDSTRWVELLPKSPLKGDSQNLFAIDARLRITHLRLNIFPDGGVARLRVHGEPLPDFRRLCRKGTTLDLAAIENGGSSLLVSDMFFGERNNMLMPGRAANMGDGWETRRRRGPGHDWSIVRLASEGLLDHIEVDTNHFKGNYPDTCSIEGIVAPHTTSGEDLSARTDWAPVLERTKLQAHTRHLFDEQLVSRGPFTHLRLNIYPDGGVSRLRVHGQITDKGAADALLRRLNALTRDEAIAELTTCCASRSWAEGVADSRPFSSRDALHAVSDAVWARATDDDIRQAFSGHPRIGERKAERDQSSREQAWSSDEQRGASSADDALRARLADANRAYEARFGHIYLVCATGKSASELLAIAESRMSNTPAQELRVAAEEQRKITSLRLDKMLSP